MLVFEDLHWADDGLLDFVDGLVDRATGVPLLILCSARPELLVRRPDWGGGKANAVTLSLSALSDEDTARLIAEHLSQAVLPAEMQQTLLRRADGNPLFAEEYIRMLKDRGLLRRDGETWRLDGTEVDVPETVQGIIAARLDALPAEEKEALQAASVVGKVFWLGSVAAIADISALGGGGAAARARAQGARPPRPPSLRRRGDGVRGAARARPRRRLRPDPTRAPRRPARPRGGVDRVARRRPAAGRPRCWPTTTSPRWS